MAVFGHSAFSVSFFLFPALFATQDILPFALGPCLLARAIFALLFALLTGESKRLLGFCADTGAHFIMRLTLSPLGTDTPLFGEGSGGWDRRTKFQALPVLRQKGVELAVARFGAEGYFADFI